MEENMNKNTEERLAELERENVELDRKNRELKRANVLLAVIVLLSIAIQLYDRFA